MISIGDRERIPLYLKGFNALMDEVLIPEVALHPLEEVSGQAFGLLDCLHRQSGGSWLKKLLLKKGKEKIIDQRRELVGVVYKHRGGPWQPS